MLQSVGTTRALSDHPLDRLLDALRRRGSRVQRSKDRARATCPVHSDSRPSLSVTWRDGRVLMRCWAGCKTGDVLSALGLRFADLFDATAATARRGWRWGLDGTPLPLYRLCGLLDARTVILTEGEKAADLLTGHGFAATCPRAGASTWADRWTGQLVDDARCGRLIILPDNDLAGVTHAQRVAAACAAWMRVTVLLLPNLPAGADVFDYFAHGGTPTDLRQLIDAAPDWTPDGAARARQQRKRDLARARKRKQRDRQRIAGHAGNDHAGHAANDQESRGECHGHAVTRSRSGDVLLDPLQESLPSKIPSSPAIRNT